MDPPRSHFKDLLEKLHEGVYFVDLDRRIRYWNKAAELITGFTNEEVIGSRCMDNLLVHVNETGLTLCQSNCPLAQTIADGKHREAEVYLHHKEGHRIPVSVRVLRTLDDTGNVTGAVEIFTDSRPNLAILSRIQDLEKLVLLDPLTELANRRYLETQIEHGLAEMGRYGWPFAIVFADIDHFKRVNDTYGHHTGDAVLKVVARTLKNNTRPFDLFGRWGGEEFVGVVRNIDQHELYHFCERLRVLVESSYILADQDPVHVTISIGATLAKPGDSPEQLLKRADALLYQSKAEGRNRVSLNA